MREVTVGQVIEITKGKKPDQLVESSAKGRTRFLQINDLRGEPPQRYVATSAGVEAVASDVLIAWDGANAGTIGWGLEGYIGSTIARLRPRDQGQIFTPYLAHFLRSKFELLNQGATGATIPHVDRLVFERLKLSLPPLTEQRRIAAILDKAGALLCKRREAIRLIDELLRSEFLEVFGDPVRNTKGWPVVRLGDLAAVVSGVTKGRRLDAARAIEVPYMRVANVQDGHLVLDDVAMIGATPEEISRYRLLEGDVLLTEGGDPDKLGRGAVWHSPIETCIHQNHVFRVRPDFDRLDPLYLSMLIGSARGKRYFLRAAKQTTGIASINMRQLISFPVLMPPLSLQNRFGAAGARIAELRSTLEESASSVRAMFGSLVARAFRGEL